MKLKRFRVSNFRSVVDSGWIETGDVTALIGTNESGKTNLLLPLWKLRPAKEGEIVPLSDMPRKEYNSFRDREPSPVFVEAVFKTDQGSAEKLAKATGLPAKDFSEIQLSRAFDGTSFVTFPEAAPARTVQAAVLRKSLASALTGTEKLQLKAEQAGSQGAVVAALKAAIDRLEGMSDADLEVADQVLAILKGGEVDDATLKPHHTKVVEDIGKLRATLGQIHPDKNEGARKLAASLLPNFVYYSNYGNLDSEIYLPHVIENLNRKGVGAKEEAKARTLKVLFRFVGLEPKEILELGREFKDPANPTRAPTPAEAAVVAEKKRERSVLLQSAGTKLTKDFRTWWKQGDYRFRFEADGDHFRIWVSDDRRPEEIELEGRSTGLQWFLSFYLVFLVESLDTHSGSILLLDEPGLSLHPLAQSDLSNFFQSLSAENQLFYTTHSPFLVDADRLDRVRKVYVADDGSTQVSSDLGSSSGSASERGSGYAVHAALGLTVAESLLIGCTPVLVEGPSDQHYLTAIKQVLAASKKFATGRELVFPPCGGVKGVKPLVNLLGSRDDKLPIVFLDGDKAGRDLADHLKDGLYRTEKDKVLDVASFLGMTDAEIEDLVPSDILAREVDRQFRSTNDTFVEKFQAGSPIVPQIEQWAKAEGIQLELGWKVDLAKRVKLLLLSKGIPADHAILGVWKSLFEKLVA